MPSGFSTAWLKGIVRGTIRSISKNVHFVQELQGCGVLDKESKANTTLSSYLRRNGYPLLLSSYIERLCE